jgi:hypothetical protein
MQTRKKFNPSYHNNEFNYLISELTDVKRSIIDIDCMITKYKYNTFIIDHKKNEDTTSLNTLMHLSNYVGVTLNDKTQVQCFIVRSNVNTETCETVNGITMIYEIKNINDVKDKKNRTDFIKGIYKTTNDSQLKLFFQQETHEATKEKLRVEF